MRAFSFRPKQATAVKTKLDISLKNQFQLARKAEFGLFQKTQNVRKTYVAYVGAYGAWSAQRKQATAAKTKQHFSVRNKPELGRRAYYGPPHELPLAPLGVAGFESALYVPFYYVNAARCKRTANRALFFSISTAIFFDSLTGRIMTRN